jgi:hypothetical protein
MLAVDIRDVRPDIRIRSEPVAAGALLEGDIAGLWPWL